MVSRSFEKALPNERATILVSCKSSIVCQHAHLYDSSIVSLSENFVAVVIGDFLIVNNVLVNGGQIRSSPISIHMMYLPDGAEWSYIG